MVVVITCNVTNGFIDHSFGLLFISLLAFHSEVSVCHLFHHSNRIKRIQFVVFAFNLKLVSSLENCIKLIRCFSYLNIHCASTFRCDAMKSAQILSSHVIEGEKKSVNNKFAWSCWERHKITTIAMNGIPLVDSNSVHFDYKVLFFYYSFFLYQR